jgi:hypothetical protein
MGKCPDIELAIHSLETMKPPRADKRAEAQAAKDAAVGARAMAYNMAAALSEHICAALQSDHADRMSLGEIGQRISDLRELGS